MSRKTNAELYERALRERDEARTRMNRMETALKKIRDLVGGESEQPDADIATMQTLSAEALDHPSEP